MISLEKVMFRANKLYAEAMGAPVTIQSNQVKSIARAILEEINETFCEPLAPSIADQDALLPGCPRRCNLCEGSPLKHHWMLAVKHLEDVVPPEMLPDGEMMLVCRHCNQRIMKFNVDDPHCPDH